MQLITMAHFGEAQAFIEKWNLEKVSEDLFKNKNLILLLTGEGPFEAATKTALTIPQYPIKKIINLGFAGAIDSRFSRGDFLHIRTVYLTQKDQLQFKTFQPSGSGFDCVTSFERIITPQKAAPLKGLGHVVDREAWGVAMASRMAHIDFACYKIISDQAGTLESCQFTRDHAEDLSHKLFDFYSSLKEIAIQEPHRDFPQGFHFTATSGHRFLSLRQKISIKKNIPEAKVLELFPTVEILKKDVAPKEKSKQLIDCMEDELDPHRMTIKKITLLLTNRFQKAGAKIQVDPQLENPKATISFEAADDKELRDRLRSLTEVSLNEWTSAMKGQFDVE